MGKLNKNVNWTGRKMLKNGQLSGEKTFWINSNDMAFLNWSLDNFVKKEKNNVFLKNWLIVKFGTIKILIVLQIDRHKIALEKGTTTYRLIALYDL